MSWVLVNQVKGMRTDAVGGSEITGGMKTM